MSVRTTADECLFKTRENIRQSIKALSEVVVDECWGSDEYNSDFRATLQQVLNDLLNIRNRLDT